MKHTKKYAHLKLVTPRYPNSADRQYYIDKAADLLLSLATVVGFVTAMLFLVTLA